MDEDDNDHEKTQIWLPGGAAPPKPRKPSAVEHEMLLKPAKKAAADSSSIDFDITTGTNAASAEVPAREQPAPVRKAPAAAPVREKSSSGLVATIALIVLVVIVGFVLTR